MAFYANRPFAIAPYMGENAFIAFTVCKVLGFRWQTALAAILSPVRCSSCMTVLRLRQWIVDGVPTSLRYSFAVGIGLFLTFIGLNETGLVRLGVPGAPVQAGNLTSHPALVAMFGFVLIAVLVIRKVPGAILLGIVVTALVAFATHVAAPPHGIVSMPPSIAPIVWQLDFRGALTWRAFPVVLTIFIMAFVDTMGTLIGLSARAGFLDENGQLPQIERPMLVDAIATCVAPALGTTTAGRLRRVGHRNRSRRPHRLHRAGHRNLLPADAVLLAVRCRHSGASLRAGAHHRRTCLCWRRSRRIDFADYTESIPAFAVVVLMAFTFNIAIGICAGFRALPNLQDRRRKSSSTEARTLGADRAVTAIFHLLSVRLIYSYLVFGFPLGGTTRRLLVT